ncbi:helix-turn-helix domain-containing protein [Marinibacterium sp. SX1]|uniref:helix-turn-helix domain-containing protein n=1 Tax=Marinibacterium sp. SX1 TaxID=3388424 RepID=UPI003D17764F
MDAGGNDWYFSGMTQAASIPVFTLFGETTAFPDVVHCERIHDRAALHGWVISAHRHRQMSQVFHIERGEARVQLDGETGRLQAGAYLYVPPQVVHGFDFARGTEGVVLSFPSPVVTRMGPKTPPFVAWLAAPRRGAVSPRIGRLITEMTEAYATSGTFRAQRLVALAHALLATLADETERPEPGAPGGGGQLQRLDALIAAHLAEGWTARDYALALHVTTGHLNRVVRGATGASLTAYLETATMTEACRLIAFTRLPLAEIAFRLSYADPSYFSRRFRARMGETPTAYRRRVQVA